MKTSINHRISQYQESINQHDMPSTYKYLIDTMNEIQRNFKLDSFTAKSVLNGYLDYTYFYFDDDFLRSQGLKLGLILNHQAMTFELWLMGRTKPIQKNIGTSSKTPHSTLLMRCLSGISSLRI